jgi:hypothetical protein
METSRKLCKITEMIIIRFSFLLQLGQHLFKLAANGSN